MSFPYEDLKVGDFVLGRVKRLGPTDAQTVVTVPWKPMKVTHVQHDPHGKLSCVVINDIEFDPRHDWSEGDRKFDLPPGFQVEGTRLEITERVK